MPHEHGGVECPKPEPKKRQKARGKRAEQKVEKAVRAACVLRDGGCRIASIPGWASFGACDGPLEWAHLPNYRRSKTRGQPPEDRHCTAGSVMLCRHHHGMLDTHQMEISPIETIGADGVLRIVRRNVSVLSIPKGTL